MRYGADLKKIIFIFLFLTTQIFAVELIEGDAGEGAATTFSFPIQSHVMSNFANFFVGAHPEGVDTTNDYAVSYMTGAGNRFYPLTPEKVSLNKITVDNPLYNKKIKHLSLLQITSVSGMSTTNSEHPVVVAQDDLTKLYVFNGFYVPSQFDETEKTHESSVSMVSIEDIKDAAGGANAKVSGTTTSGGCIFAPVYPNAGAFGDDDSGVALLIYGDKTTEVDGEKQVQRAVVQNGNAAAVDKSSTLLTLGADLTNLTFNDICWDLNIGVLYIALAANGTNGTRAVVAGQIKDNLLVLKKIVPDAVFTANNEIIGTSASSSVEIKKIRTMFASTWLSYLIVLGGNSTVDTDRDIFALPIVNKAGDDAHGTLAKFDADPIELFSGDKEKHSVFWGNRYETAATANADILKTTSDRAKVGGGSAPGDVVDMLVVGDSVFVAVDITYANGVTKKRVYFSRALLDELGRIESWTAWQPAKAAESKLFGFRFNMWTEQMITLENDLPPNNNADDHKGVKSVRRTQWGSGDEDGLGDLVTVLDEQFPNQDGGIHGLFDFPSNYPGVGSAGFMIATGRKKVALIETERDSEVNKGNFSANTVSFTNGSVTQTFGVGNATRVVVISGGVLDDLGPIESAEIAYKGSTLSTRVFVGGPGGLAALVNTDISGIAGELTVGFEGITSTMSFKKIGSYSFVRKLFADASGNFLYVLTDKKLDRIDLTTNSLTAVTLAQAGTGSWDSQVTFLDIIVSQKFCLLGTSNGLYRTGNGKDVTTADPGWTKVEQPGASGPALRLQAITENGLEQDLLSGGAVQVLNGYIGKNRAKLNRFSVVDYSGSAITDTTIQPLPDGFIQQRTGGLSKTPYFNHGIFKNDSSYVGGFTFSSRDRDNLVDPLAQFFGSYISAGRLASVANRSVPIELSGTSDIVSLVRSSASGDLLIATDTGLFVNE